MEEVERLIGVMSKLTFSSFFPFLGSSPSSPLIHRDLSWIQFNERVLAEARKNSNPLLERFKFLAISSSNLDEFFMIRVSALERGLQLGKKRLELGKVKRLSETREELYKAISRFIELQSQTLKELVKELASHQIFLHLGLKRKEPSFQVAKELFETQILPYLPSPQLFDSKLLNSLESLQTGLILPGGHWLKVPKNLPSLLGKSSPDQKKWDFFFLDHLLPLFLGPALPVPWTPSFLRLTRDGEYEYDLADTDTESIPDVVKSRIGIRERGKPIRLQTFGHTTTPFLEEASKSLSLEPAQVFEAPGTLYLQGLWSLYHQIPLDFGKGNLKFRTAVPQLPPSFNKANTLFDELKNRDLLLHHPYDSFDAFVTFIKQASEDPNVISIEQTIYRMDTLSPVIRHLKKAAKTKKVRVLIELRARFDEWNNLNLATELQEAGIEVGYGFGKLKLHAKIALITRKESGKLKTYTHLSTGNYNSATARTYTDLAILTSNDEMGSDARVFFDSVFSKQVPMQFQQWVVAPHRLAKKVQSLIEAEISAAQRGEKARIFAKVNALVDEQTIESLYRASQAGVKIDLVVRGACSLIPGLKGISENIQVVSILDYYLEHSRIYFFESSHKMYLSSADWMPRNFLRRLEIAFPVLDERIYSFLRDVVIPAYLSDTAQGKELTSQGVWKERVPQKSAALFRSQVFFRELAEKRYKGTPIE